MIDSLLRPRAPRAAVLLVAVAALLASAGCGADSEAPAAPASAAGPTSPPPAVPAALQPGDPVPAPTGKVLLVLRGTTTTNVGDELHLDRDLLESLGTVEHVVDDRLATGVTATFSGPLMSSVLAVAGAGAATTMHTIALNDYVADVPVSDAADLPLIIATRMDGRPMSVANYGPTRFVYPTDLGLDRATYEPRWVWQLATIELT